MTEIKQRRLSLPVGCHAGTKVGDYVPFCFCPRSIMLYVIHCANHPGLSYRGGQWPIVHLASDLYTVVDWANANDTKWAFSLSNAAAAYRDIRSRVEDFEQLRWEAIEATDFRDPDVKEGKQAEFLVHGFFPWVLVERIGVHSQTVGERALAAFGGAQHRPGIEIRRDWYY